MANFQLVFDQVMGATPIAFYLLVVVMGAVWGSFATCAAYRLPRKISLWWPPSHCPVCQKRLGFWDLWPLLSFIVMRGRCRHCGTKIPVRYVYIEGLSVLISVFVALAGGVQLLTLALVFVAQMLFLCGLIRYESGQWPPRLLPFSFILLLILLF